MLSAAALLRQKIHILSAMYKKPLWILLFALFFILAMDFWRWERPLQTTALGLPDWLPYFIVLQLGLTTAIAIFCWTFWLRKGPKSDKEAKD